jgi:hypothetical protein
MGMIENYYRRNFSYSFDFLLCSIFVLDTHNDLFKKLNLQKGIYFTNQTYDYNLNCIIDIEYFLNKPSLRKFASVLIKPIILNKCKIYSTSLDITTKPEMLENELLLRGYLKKYRSYYKQHFLSENSNKDFLKDYELNVLAIKSLFLIVGI